MFSPRCPQLVQQQRSNDILKKKKNDDATGTSPTDKLTVNDIPGIFRTCNQRVD